MQEKMKTSLLNRNIFRSSSSFKKSSNTLIKIKFSMQILALLMAFMSVSTVSGKKDPKKALAMRNSRKVYMPGVLDTMIYFQ